MATTITLNSVTYSIPAVGASRTWGTSLSLYLIAISTATLQKSGGAFQLTADANFGSSKGLISLYYKSYTADAAGNSAASGVVRLGNAESIGWRNQANGADKLLTVNASDKLAFDGGTVAVTADKLSAFAATTSAELAGVISDETGSGGGTGLLVFSSSPTLTTPVITTNGSIDVSGAGTLTIGASVGANDLTLGGAASTVVVAGNLRVDGTTTTATLDVEDTNITVNNGGDNTSSEGAGLTVERTGTSGSLIYADAAASKFKIGALGSEAEVATISHSQTLTNKTLTAPVISSISNTGTLTLPTSTDTLVGRATTDTLTNKTLDKPVINQADITQATSATTPAGGKSAIYVNSNDAKLHVVDSSGNDVPVGSGSSGRNYLSDWHDSTKDIGSVTNSLGDTLASSDRTANKTTWGSSDTSLLTIAKSTSSALRESTNYLITEAGSSSGAFIESPLFTLDGVDLGKPVSVRFDVTGNATDDDYQAYICRYDSNDVLQERLVISGGNASSTSPYSSKLPVGTTKFQGMFISSSTSTDQYTLRIVSNNSSASSIRIDSLYIGPDTVVQGAAITDWTSFTPTGTWSSNTTYTGFYRRVGDVMEGTIKVATSGAPTSASLVVSIPSAFTVNTSVMADTTNGYPPVGTLIVNDSSSTGYLGVVAYDSSANELRCLIPTAASNSMVAVTQAVPITFGASDSVSINFKLPIAEWTSNITMANRAVEEYAYTTGTWDADDSTTGYGAAGVAMGGALTTGRDKIITWQTPLQSTDKIFVEVSEDRVQWFDADRYSNAGGTIVITNSLSSAGTFATSGGIFISKTTGSRTQIRFCRYASIGNDDTPVIDWSSAIYWRVRKVSSGASVGFPISARNIVGDITGTTIPAGYIGEIMHSSGSQATITENGTTFEICSAITLTPGTWMVSASASVGTSSGTLTLFQIAIDNASASVTGTTIPNTATGEIARAYSSTTGFNTSNFPINIAPYPVYVTSGTLSLYLNGQVTHSQSNATVTGYITAVRVG